MSSVYNVWVCIFHFATAMNTRRFVVFNWTNYNYRKERKIFLLFRFLNSNLYNNLFLFHDGDI